MGSSHATYLIDFRRAMVSLGENWSGLGCRCRGDAQHLHSKVVEQDLGVRLGPETDAASSAWLIRRWIDPRATFKFVAPKGYVSEHTELRFDMFDAEFGHEGDQCTFEVLCTRFGLAPVGLSAIAEVVHDIDLKDKKFDRPETPGVSAQIMGLASLHREDEVRLQHGSQLFEQLFAFYARPSNHPKAPPASSKKRRR
jgi:hypothetical protein